MLLGISRRFRDLFLSLGAGKTLFAVESSQILENPFTQRLAGGS